MPEALLTLRFILTAHEPQIQLLQTLSRIVDDATLADASRSAEVQSYFAAVLNA